MNKVTRKAIIAGNWKMNKTATEAAELIGDALGIAVGHDLSLIHI